MEIAINATTLYVLLILFVATLIRSALGFGEALVAVPLLALVLPVRVAAPLAVLVSVTIAGIVVAQDWKHVELRSSSWLLLATLFGIPFGLLLLTSSHPELIKGLLAVILLGLSVYFLTGKKPPELYYDNRRWLGICGFCAGVLGGAYGMNGPPLALYGAMRRWPPAQFRATLQGYFLPASLIGMCGFWLAGLWVPAVTRYYLYSLPVTLPAVFLGRTIHRRLEAERFQRYVYAALACIGALLLAQAIAGTS